LALWKTSLGLNANLFDSVVQSVLLLIGYRITEAK
jgi:hypothetical protein